MGVGEGGERFESLDLQLTNPNVLTFYNSTSPRPHSDPLKDDKYINKL